MKSSQHCYYCREMSLGQSVCGRVSYFIYSVGGNQRETKTSISITLKCWFRTLAFISSSNRLFFILLTNARLKVN